MSASNDLLVTPGSVVQLKRTGTGTFEASQLEIATPFPAPELIGDFVIPFHYEFGPVSIDGLLNTSAKTITATVKVFGHTLGTFTGGLDTGIVINVDLFIVKGTIRLYVKNGHELWLMIDLKPIVGPPIHLDVKILDF